MASKKSFSIQESIKYGWSALQGQPVIILYILVAIVGTRFIEFVFSLVFPQASEEIVSIVGAIMTVVSIILSIGMIRVVLNVYEKKKLRPENLYEDWKLIGWYLLAGLINAVVVFVGFLLLVIPGIYIALRLSLWPYIMLDGEKKLH